jgi:hypothetical protein
MKELEDVEASKTGTEKVIASAVKKFKKEKSEVFNSRSTYAKLMDKAKEAIRSVGVIGWAAIRQVYLISFNCTEHFQ